MLSLVRWGAVLIIFLCGLGSLQAVTITVSEFIDDDPAVDNAKCSLREAIIAANTDKAVDACPAGKGADSIVLPVGNYTLTRIGSGEDAAATGDLDITASLSIKGQVVGNNITTIKGDEDDRVFHILSTNAPVVTLTDLAITKGKGVGGGIYNQADLTLKNVRIYGNTSLSDGAGIVNVSAAKLTLQDCRVYSNNASNRGGGIDNKGTLSLSGTTVGPANAAALAGGISNSGGIADITNSTITANTASPYLAGGLLNDANGVVTITNSTISNNTAATKAGGIEEASNQGSVTLINSTVSGNTATDAGGGIQSDSGTVFLIGSMIGPNNSAGQGGGVKIVSSFYADNVTISGNRTQTDGGGVYARMFSAGRLNNVTIANNTAAGFGGGVYSEINAVFALRNTIISGNISNSTTSHDCSGPLTTNGYNLIQNMAGCDGAGIKDLTGIDPMLVVLAGNGGATKTHALPVDSPAIDAGDPAGCLDHNDVPLTKDQRQEARPIDGNNDTVARCDIGAFELTPPPNIRVTDSSDPADDHAILFGTINPGEKSQQELVTIMNTGYLDLNVSGIQLTGSDADEYSLDLNVGDRSCVSALLAAGESCKVGIILSPVSTGEKAATLVIASNDADENPLNVTLTGLGNAAPVFTGGTGSVKIVADAAIGTVITTLTAADKTSTSISFAIVSGNDSGVFAINGNSGAINLASALDYGAQPLHELVVSVTDNYGLSVEATVTVNVQDVFKGDTPADTTGDSGSGSSDSGGGSGGGGGCSIHPGTPFDPLMPLMVLLAFGYLLYRRECH